MQKLRNRLPIKPTVNLVTPVNRSTRNALLWAIGLMASGLLLLVWTLGLLAPYEPWTQIGMALLLLGLGGGFFSGYLARGLHEQRAGWWRFIPAWTMVALAIMLLVGTLLPEQVELIAALLFWGLAVAFLHIYWLQRANHWWALIPGGFMVVLGAVIQLSAVTKDLPILGACLFAGMGVVFFVLYAVSSNPRHWWALVPGGVLVSFGVLILLSASTANHQLTRWWPVIIILIGLSILWRLAGRKDTPQAPHTPTPRQSASPTVEVLPDRELG